MFIYTVFQFVWIFKPKTIETVSLEKRIFPVQVYQKLIFSLRKRHRFCFLFYILTNLKLSLNCIIIYLIIFFWTAAILRQKSYSTHSKTWSTWSNIPITLLLLLILRFLLNNFIWLNHLSIVENTLDRLWIHILYCRLTSKSLWINKCLHFKIKCILDFFFFLPFISKSRLLCHGHSLVYFANNLEVRILHDIDVCLTSEDVLDMRQTDDHNRDSDSNAVTLPLSIYGKPIPQKLRIILLQCRSNRPAVRAWPMAGTGRTLWSNS